MNGKDKQGGDGGNGGGIGHAQSMFVHWAGECVWLFVASLNLLTKDQQKWNWFRGRVELSRYLYILFFIFLSIGL